MKVSLNTIRALNQRYGATGDVAKDGVEQLIKKVDAQLGAIEEIIEFGKPYQDIVIVKVVSCEQHPNAEKLQLCKIDDGSVVKEVDRDSDSLVQVVCGAPNVKSGMLAAWLPPGNVVPETANKEPFKLEAREIRGEVSNGMLASPKELALGDNHAGILEIEGDYQPGADFAEAFNLKDDVVIDIENKMFTHRPDTFGYLGIARELAGIQGMAFQSPSWYTPNPQFPEVEAEELPLEVRNELSGLVPRFTMVPMREVEVGPSPAWLQVELAKVGVRSINNIVDYTNWFMLETGQPLHAYDYDKVQSRSDGDGAVVVVRKPRASEKLKLLNGKTIDPGQDLIMIATDQELIGVGGVMGGADTEVDFETKNIILEAGNFDMYSVRRASMAHGLFTDAVTRFNKGQSPLQPLSALAKIVEEIRQYAGGKVAGPVIDINHLDKSVMERGSMHQPVGVTVEFINERLGLKLSTDDIKHLLENVEFKIKIKANELNVQAPFWRTDIELREDVVEEVGRLYGYDKLSLDLPGRDLTPAKRDKLLDAKAEVRSRLSEAGANEVLTYSFVHGDLLAKVGQDKAQAYQISNALSPDLQYYRLSLMPSLLEKIHPNIKAGYDEFALFELGKTHGLDNGMADDLPREFEFTALVVTAADKLKKAGAAYYQARRYLETLIWSEALEFKPVSSDFESYQVVQPYNLQRSALVSLKGGDFLGIIGEFKASVLANLKLPQYTAGFEIDTVILAPLLAAGTSYAPLPRFPKVIQDITLKVSKKRPYAEVYEFVKEQVGHHQPDEVYAHLEPADSYAKKGSDDINLTFRLTIASYKRTLTDKEVNKLLDEVAAAAKSKLGAERV